MTQQGAGVPPYQGYEYQILGTVWFALQVMVAKAQCKSIFVEPASGEDIEAKLMVDPESATSQVGVEFSGGPLDVQIKLRRSGHWTEAPFRDMIRGKNGSETNRGPNRRDRPLDRLKSTSNLQFLLLTNAQVKADQLSQFVVQEIGQPSSAVSLPSDKDDDLDLAKRIGILPECTPELLTQQIYEVLRIYGHVPSTKCKACLGELLERVRDRLLAKRDPTWLSDEIANVITNHDGFPTLTLMDLFVPPNNFDNAKSQLETSHALLLTGPPGSGKTTIAQVLVHEHRVDDNPYEVISDNASVSTIRQLLERPDRYLFFLEDPWGHYKTNDDCDRWASELPKLMARADRDKKFVVTSRTGVKHQALAGGSVELDAAEIAIVEANYDRELRARILRVHLEGCATWQADLVARERDRIRNRLRVPMALKLFATKLRHAESEGDLDLDELIRSCNMEAIAADTASEIEHLGRPAIAGAVILWAMSMVSRGIQKDVVDEIRKRASQAGSPACEPKRVLTFLVETGLASTRQEGIEIHPSVLEGIELLTQRQTELADDVFSAMLTGLTSGEEIQYVKRLISRLQNRRLSIPQNVQEALNDYLIRTLLTAENKHEIEGAFFDVERWCTAEDPVTWIVRGLTNKRRKYGFEVWEPPSFSEEQIQRIADCENARLSASRFVQGVLPFASVETFRATELLSFFGQFNWDLSADFRDAAEDCLRGDGANLDILIEGALACDNPPHEELIALAANTEDDAAKQLDENKEELRQAEQAEMGDNRPRTA